MSAEQIVPAVAVHHCGRLHVPAHVNGLVALYAESCLRVNLNLTDMSKICSCGEPEPAVRIQEDTWVDGIEVLVNQGLYNHHRF